MSVLFMFLCCCPGLVDASIHQGRSVHKKGGMVTAQKREILRCAQDDSSGLCHPEHSEGSGLTNGEVVHSEPENLMRELENIG